jgi:hypothetical protein
MKNNPLLPLLLTGAIVLAAANLLIGAWNHRLPYEMKLEAIRSAHDPNLLFVGNSLLDHHLDEAALKESAKGNGIDFVPLNSALGASEPPEQRLLFNYAVKNHSGIRTLVVGIFDFQLTAEDHSRITDLTGNRMVGLDHRFPASEVAQAYGFSSLERLEISALQRAPMAANRANIWKYVELLRRSMGAMGMPHAAVNSMGRVEDFNALESGSSQQFDAQAAAFLQRPDHFNSSYEAVFTAAQAKGMKVVIVVMPMSPYHHQAFYSRPLWNEYLQALTALASQRGIRVIDASGWIPEQQGYVDHLHMSPEAVHTFSARLGSELAGAPQP